MIDLEGKVAFVSGASAGLGAGIADRLADAGASVYRHSGRTGPDGGDLGDPQVVESVLRRAYAQHGRLDIVVNNAALQPVSSFTEITGEEWDGVVAAGLTAVHHVTQAAAELMSGGGAIVNIASIEGLQPAMGHAHYSTVKAGVIMHTRTAAAALGHRSIRVNSVSPGLIDRQGLAEGWPDGVNRYLSAAPLARLGQPLDVANAVVFLASDLSAWITGANLVVDGGVLSRSTW
ncbi:MAG: SDR family oxidoreductase [Acidimicrobiales bacterium]|nr:SDR family oxidoreductase [Acidimicrobiales bacterium]